MDIRVYNYVNFMERKMKILKYFALGILRVVYFIIFFITVPIWIFIIIGGGSKWVQELTNKIIPNCLIENEKL